MQEVLEQILDYLKGIWIKRRYLMIATWLICPLGWLVVSQLQDTYESEARVFADTQSILSPLLRGMTVETNPDLQIRQMVSTLLSRPNLERIARMTDLDVQANTPQEFDNLIKRLKNGISINKTGGNIQNIFNIKFTDQNPTMARDVVQSVLTVFIENTRGDNRKDSDSAQKFIDSQINEYENRLLKAEARLTNFKQKYSEVLPNQYGGYYQKLNNSKEQLKTIELILLETKTQLAESKAKLTQSSTSESNQQNNIVDSNSIKTTFDDRIAELEGQLDSLQLRYTEQHPDVKEVQRRLEHLSKKRDDEIEQYLTSSNEAGNDYTPISQNPVIQDIQIQVNQLEGQVASMEVRANNYRNVVKELENKIHTLPEIEAELVALDRGYEITKKQYETLLERREKAQIGQSADETTSKINFKVIDPPRVPLKPAGPKRMLFYVVVTFLGVGVGLGLSFLFSQINPIVTSGSQVARATGIPIFGIVSATENIGLQSKDKRKTILFFVSNSLLILILCFFIAYSLFPDAIQAPIHRIFNL
ncbi:MULTISPECIES: XrtA system polysaccharide chain length determinant [unclassified Colwellia]|uniref:XrtA system polysaccharide chain length determinant n=1 Tax=unclassified Colwellia TaxID=196834 RepID=UPI0015F54277|nr:MULTISPECIES: XrtA system polysaccharide chain length determinant [unclassified Colwellia]MBA6357609.1 chain length determinant family protein [Colwellia sp. BRX8-3]MBA6361433.1 chain length determinant family protein [Colwellia sp. BRX8-6]MBA6369536.1 chain length determinant family protein [Colwellia sp. BRX8-5]MBA6376040.1 chain length determinant family protein [Colwellia sp. BRX8-2]